MSILQSATRAIASKAHQHADNDHDCDCAACRNTQAFRRVMHELALLRGSVQLAQSRNEEKRQWPHRNP